MHRPSVSVVIPCSDEAEFIQELLDAVRAQDLPPIETIVVDNGSTDASVALVNAYATKHPRCRSACSIALVPAPQQP